MSDKQYAPGLEQEMEEMEATNAAAGESVFAAELGEADQEGRAKAQQHIDEIAVKEMTHEAGGLPREIFGIKVRKLSFTSFALLQEIESAYVTQAPGMTTEQYERLGALAKESDAEDRGGKRMSQRKRAELQKLMSLAYKDAQSVGNLWMEILKFFAVMDADLSIEDAHQLVFIGGGSAVDLAALKIGEKIGMEDFAEVSKEINEFIQSQQGTRMEPVPDKKKKGQPGEVDEGNG